jgi:hypothetical protein
LEEVLFEVGFEVASGYGDGSFAGHVAAVR